MLTLVALPLLSPILRREFIFDHAPFKACHASTIAQNHEGGLIAAWFGGDKEGAPNVDIYVARRDLATGWTPPRVAATGHGEPCWNPVLFQPASGPLLLFYKLGKSAENWSGMVTTSSDSGATWTVPQHLPKGILGPIKNKPIQLSDGTILCGSSEQEGGWRIHMEQTSDFGASWSRTPDLNNHHRIEAIQPSLLAMGAGRIRALGRTLQSRIFSIDSEDNGKTWGAMRLTSLPNNNSGIDAVRLLDGRYLLAYNDTTKERTPLSIAVSDDAEHWTKIMNVEKGPGEFSYPAIIQSEDGLVHLTYTWKRISICHVVIDPALF